MKKVLAEFCHYANFLSCEGSKALTENASDSFSDDRSTMRGKNPQSETNFKLADRLGGYRTGLVTFAKRGFEYHSARPFQNKTTMKLQIAAILLSPAIFSIFSLAIASFSSYLLNRKTKPTNTMQNTEIIKLIESAKGRFFSITFQKKDGTLRTINSKDKYFRLIKGEQSTVQEAGYVSAVNRNKESWFCFQPEKVKAFKCGAIEKTF